jgi:hypothetical protein
MYHIHSCNFLPEASYYFISLGTEIFTYFFLIPSEHISWLSASHLTTALGMKLCMEQEARGSDRQDRYKVRKHILSKLQTLSAIITAMSIFCISSVSGMFLI